MPLEEPASAQPERSAGAVFRELAAEYFFDAAGLLNCIADTVAMPEAVFSRLTADELKTEIVLQSFSLPLSEQAMRRFSALTGSLSSWNFSRLILREVHWDSRQAGISEAVWLKPHCAACGRIFSNKAIPEDLRWHGLRSVDLLSATVGEALRAISMAAQGHAGSQSDLFLLEEAQRRLEALEICGFGNCPLNLETALLSTFEKLRLAAAWLIMADMRDADILLQDFLSSQCRQEREIWKRIISSLRGRGNRVDFMEGAKAGGSAPEGAEAVDLRPKSRARIGSAAQSWIRLAAFSAGARTIEKLSIPCASLVRFSGPAGSGKSLVFDRLFSLFGRRSGELASLGAFDEADAGVGRRHFSAVVPANFGPLAFGETFGEASGIAPALEHIILGLPQARQAGTRSLGDGERSFEFKGWRTSDLSRASVSDLARVFDTSSSLHELIKYQIDAGSGGIHLNDKLKDLLVESRQLARLACALAPAFCAPERSGAMLFLLDYPLLGMGEAAFLLAADLMWRAVLGGHTLLYSDNSEKAADLCDYSIQLQPQGAGNIITRAACRQVSPSQN